MSLENFVQKICFTNGWFELVIFDLKKTILLLKNILFGRLVRFELSDKNVHLNVKLALININPCIIQIKIKWNCLAMQMTTISYRTTEKN